MVAPFTDAWIETAQTLSEAPSVREVAPFTGAWIETEKLILVMQAACVAPFTGATHQPTPQVYKRPAVHRPVNLFRTVKSGHDPVSSPENRPSATGLTPGRKAMHWLFAANPFKMLSVRKKFIITQADTTEKRRVHDSLISIACPPVNRKEPSIG